jgi:hypothetical protein
LPLRSALASLASSCAVTVGSVIEKSSALQPVAATLPFLTDLTLSVAL